MPEVHIPIRVAEALDCNGYHKGAIPIRA
jgi:hypothetical protein